MSSFIAASPNSFAVLSAHLAPALIRAFVMMPPDVRPSQSMWVRTWMLPSDFMQSFILSRSAPIDASIEVSGSVRVSVGGCGGEEGGITRVGPRLIYISKFWVSALSSCSIRTAGAPLPR